MNVHKNPFTLSLFMSLSSCVGLGCTTSSVCLYGLCLQQLSHPASFARTHTAVYAQACIHVHGMHPLHMLMLYTAVHSRCLYPHQLYTSTSTHIPVHPQAHSNITLNYIAHCLNTRTQSGVTRLSKQVQRWNL